MNGWTWLGRGALVAPDGTLAGVADFVAIEHRRVEPEPYLPLDVPSWTTPARIDLVVSGLTLSTSITRGPSDLARTGWVLYVVGPDWTMEAHAVRAVIERVDYGPHGGPPEATVLLVDVAGVVRAAAEVVDTI